MQLERRFFSSPEIEIEKREDGTPSRISGYASVFNSLSKDLGGFVEVIRPGTFARSIKEEADVVANVNHNMEQPLGRISKGTLTLSEDARGLRFSVAIPDTSYARDAVANIQNGNLIGCSFAFTVPEEGDYWRQEAGKLLRELHDVNLFDVAAVTTPAYGATEVSLRCLEMVKEGVQPVALPIVPLGYFLRLQSASESML